MSVSYRQNELYFDDSIADAENNKADGSRAIADEVGQTSRKASSVNVTSSYGVGLLVPPFPAVWASSSDCKFAKKILVSTIYDVIALGFREFIHRRWMLATTRYTLHDVRALSLARHFSWHAVISSSDKEPDDNGLMCQPHPIPRHGRGLVACCQTSKCTNRVSDSM